MKPSIRPLSAFKWALLGLSVAVTVVWLLNTDWEYIYRTRYTVAGIHGGRLVITSHHLPHPFDLRTGWSIEDKLTFPRHPEFLDFSLETKSWRHEFGYYETRSLALWPYIAGFLASTWIIWIFDAMRHRSPPLKTKLQHTRIRRWLLATACLGIASAFVASWSGWRLAYCGDTFEVVFVERGFTGCRWYQNKGVSGNEVGRWGTPPYFDVGNKVFFPSFHFDPDLGLSTNWAERLGFGWPKWGASRNPPYLSRYSGLSALGYMGSVPPLAQPPATQPTQLFLLPFWMILLPLMVVTVITNRRAFRLEPGACVVCGYDLTHNTLGRCPECGKASIPATSAAQPAE